MKITRTSIATGVTRTLDLPKVTKERLEEWRPSNGAVGKNIQDVFPDLTPDEREFLLTGIVSEEWDKLFSS